MLNLYFACTDCKVYVDAGYRWASWRLEEPGIVSRGQRVPVSSVLSATQYWTPAQTDGADWLRTEVLPSARRFLKEHERHQIIFGNTSDFLSLSGDDLLDWMEVGFSPLLLPRYFVERLGLVTWDQVSSFIARQDSTPWWWMLDWDDVHAKAKKKFQELVESGGSRKKTQRCSLATHLR